MSDIATALGGARSQGSSSVSEAPMQGMITLRGNLADPALVAAVTGLTGADMPSTRQITQGKGGSLGWMSPDELLILVPHQGVTDAVRDRLGAVDVFAEPDGGHENDRVRVIRRRHDYGVDVVRFPVEHPAKVVITGRRGILLERRPGALVVQVAQGHNPLVFTSLQVGLAHTTDAHASDSQRIAGRLITGAAEDVAGHDEGRSQPRPEDTASRHARTFDVRDRFFFLG